VRLLLLFASLCIAACGVTTTTTTTPAPADAGATPEEEEDDPPAVRADAGTKKDSGATQDSGTRDSGGTTTYPAPHPPMPRVINNGGPVIPSPKITVISYAKDPLVSQIEDFASRVGTTTYWTATTAEYGVGAASTRTPVHLAEAAPTSIDDDGVQAWLRAKLDGTHPEFGTPDGNSIYAIYYPAQTTITLFGLTSCQHFGGYHNSVQLPGGAHIAYAVMPRCNWGQGSDLDQLTSTSTHEFIEAATDPHPLVNPAWTGVDDDHVIWQMLFLGEVSDLCSSFADSQYKPAGLGYTVQRSWSNLAAKQGKDPCAPNLPGEIYFNSAPVMNDTIGFEYQGQSGQTKGVKIPIGQSKTIELQLYSEGPIGPWDVRANDFNQGILSFRTSATRGKNGDKIQLTITRTGTDPNYGGAPFVVISQIGDVRHYWFGLVGD
jgi:hypothetical protein